MDARPEIALSDAEIRALGEIAGAMIPADTGLGMPGADDPVILADIARSLGRDLALVREALVAIATKSRRSLAELDPTARDALLNDYYAQGGAPAIALGRAVLGAYYRDDRVLLALGHEARAPFPGGYRLEQGDWTLLDPVRKRPAFWRDDRGASTGDR
jgi:hypothetical protein